MNNFIETVFNLSTFEFHLTVGIAWAEFSDGSINNQSDDYDADSSVMPRS